MTRRSMIKLGFRVKKKPAKPPKPTAKICDKLWKALIKARAKQPCEISDISSWQHRCNGGAQAAHGASRKYRGTRWSIDNGWRLCSKAHLILTYDPIQWRRILIEIAGAEFVEKLEDRSLAGRKIKDKRRNFKRIANTILAEVTEPILPAFTKMAGVRLVKLLTQPNGSLRF